MVKADLHDDGDVSSLADSARNAAKRRDWAEAYRCWEELRKRRPGHLPAYLGSAGALRKAERLADAQELLTLTVARFPDSDTAAIAHAWAANSSRDWALALSRWETVRRRFPDNAWGYLGSVQALRAAGQAERADGLLSQAETLAAGQETGRRNRAESARLTLEIAKARADWHKVKLAAQWIIDDGHATAEIFLAAAHAHWHLKEAAEADHAAAQALAADPSSCDALLVQVWVATAAGDGPRAVGCYRRLVEINPSAVRWWLKLIQLLNWLGQVDEAVRGLAMVNRRWPDDPAVKVFMRNYGPAAALQVAATAVECLPRWDPHSDDDMELKTLVDRAPPPARRLRPLLIDYPERDVLTAAKDGMQTAVLIFTGSNDAASMPLSIFDLYLCSLPAAGIYLKDFARLRFLSGIRSLSGEYHGTLSALRRLVSDLGATRVCTLGNCDGGFAAIRYGVELNADRILTFNAPTHNPDDASLQFEQARNFKRTRLAALGGDFGDLRSFLEGRPHGCKIDFFYEHDDLRDRTHALHLSGLPGVTLHAGPTSGEHRLLRTLALSSADFPAFLAEYLDLRPAMPAAAAPPASRLAPAASSP